MMKTEDYRKSFDNVQFAFMIVNSDEYFSIVYCNSLFYGMLDYTEDDLRNKYGNCLSALLDAGTMKKLHDYIEKPGKSPIELEHTIRNRMSKELWVSSQISTAHLKDENLIFIVSRDISKYKEAEIELIRNRNRDKFIRYCSELDIIEYNCDTKKVEILEGNTFSNACIDKGALFPDCVLSNELIHPEYKEKLLKAMCRVEEKGSSFCELLVKSLSGKYKWFSLSLSIYEEGHNRSVVGILKDTSAEKEAVQNYLNETLFYQAILSQTEAYGHLDVEEDKVLRVGGIWNLYNELLPKITFSQLYTEFIDKVVQTEDRERYKEIMQIDNFKKSFKNGITHIEYEFRRIVELNKVVWMSISIELFENPMNHHIMGMLYLKNIDEQKKEKIVLEHETGRDSLTNLYNRETTIRIIKDYLQGMEKDEYGAFLLLNLKDFRDFNTRHGYQAGDQLLIKISRILSKIFRKYDILGRFGGDEFAVFIRDVDCISFQLKKRLDSVFESMTKEPENQIFGNIGIVYVERGNEFDPILEDARDCLLKAKEMGDNQYFVFNEELMEREEMPGDWDESRIEKRHMYSEYFPKAFCSGDSSDEFDMFMGTYGEISYLINPKNFDLICGNQAFYDRVGLTEAQCKNMKCYEVMHKRTQPCPFCGNVNWTRDKFYLYRNYNEALEQEFLIKNKLVQWKNKEVLLAIAVDLSNNKTILDSMENDTTENHSILSGIQNMQNSHDMGGVMARAMETVGTFFRAESVLFWSLSENEDQYMNQYIWESGKRRELSSPSDTEQETVSTWLKNRKWLREFTVESQEMMLCNSYDLYERMQKNYINNQQWYLLQDDDEKELGIIEVRNRSINLLNTSFMSSFSRFIVSEWKKHNLLNNTLYNSRHDRLTGALNRVSYELFLSQYQEINVDSVGVVSVNIDRLKNINKAKSFQTGNQVLIKLVQVLQKVFGKDYVYRLSGDDFLVLMPNVKQNELEGGMRKVEELLKEINEFSVSMGYAWESIEKEVSSLVETATQVMRKNKMLYYGSAYDMDKKERSDVLSNLLSAIESGKIVVYLQAKVDNSRNKMIGAEALIRYDHPDHGVVPPGKFIKLLEDYGVVRFIDLFVFEEVCKLLTKWISEGRECPRISLNFSRITMIENDLIKTMETIFNKYKIPKDYLEIEITESYADIGKALLNQRALDIRNEGYRISLDDFGTNFTNLTILSDIEVDVLKLDRSLICSLENDHKNKTILKNVIQMCKDLDIEVIAEGVETNQQEDILKELGCHLIQGYLYSKPVPIVDFERKFMEESQIQTVPQNSGQ